ncbi:MAG: sulfatase-like hydrolase/transferase [Bacteroidales bacterium]
MKSAKLLGGLALLTPVALAGANDRPNIIFFLVDDNGYVDSQVPYGYEVYPNNNRFDTPNMLKLASEGVIMTNAYVAPLSTPTRTCLMTGANPAQLKVTDYTEILRDTPSDANAGSRGLSSEQLKTAKEASFFAPGEWNYNGISPVPGTARAAHITPFPQLLSDSGYYTILVGKAHFAPAGTPGANPYNFGFDVSIAGASSGNPTSFLASDNYGNAPGKWDYWAVQNMAEYYGSDVFLTDAITKEALKTLEYPVENNLPFFLYLSHFATHSPIQADSLYYNKYVERGMSEGIAKYASMVEGVDASLGAVRAYLEEHNITKNTIIIFMTDNGGDSVNKAKGAAHTANKPLREGKASVYEGGIHVPMMFCWPGRIAAGTRINTPVSAEDVFPTILDMAKVKGYEAIQTLDGQSLVKLLTKGSREYEKAAAKGAFKNQKEECEFVVPASVSGIDPDRALIFHLPHQWRYAPETDIDFMSAVRKGDWKLVYKMKTASLELYNLMDDIGESTDLASEHPEKVAELAKILSDKLRGWNATMPIDRTTGKPVPMPDEVLGL